MAKSKRPVALVTGAANGIGRAIAKHLAETGWCVGALDLPKTGLGRAFGRTRNVLMMEGDVTDERTAPACVDALLEHYGRLDAVVSNAGIMTRKPLRQLKLSEWYRVIDTNLTAALLLAQAAEKALRASNGSIVSIASTSIARSNWAAVTVRPYSTIARVGPSRVSVETSASVAFANPSIE